MGQTSGYVTTRGRTEVTLCALPPRVSMNGYFGRKSNYRQQKHLHASMVAFEASNGPEVAVRRFMIYGTFLHGLGPLQVIDPSEKRPNRRFASEGKAQEFCDHWRRKLWSVHF